jgi:hypothetical protein
MPYHCVRLFAFGCDVRRRWPHRGYAPADSAPNQEPAQYDGQNPRLLAAVQACWIPRHKGGQSGTGRPARMKASASRPVDAVENTKLACHEKSIDYHVGSDGSKRRPSACIGQILDSIPRSHRGGQGGLLYSLFMAETRRERDSAVVTFLPVDMMLQILIEHKHIL